MTYKETLFFIGKCLTISHEEKNKIEIETELKNNSVDWDAVVKVSTEHYVFPALYCNLKRADFLHYLPEDLVGYMEHITNLNRERNQQIIEQAKEINELLLANNITPIFLKGTGNLLEGLYEDIGERMVGDIDFIVSKDEYLETIRILYIDGYKPVVQENHQYPHFRHYTSLIKKNKIGAIEVHKELIREKYINEFNYRVVNESCKLVKNITILSDENKLSLTIIAFQINDYGNIFKSISFRNSYDVYLLSKKIDTKNILLSYKNLKEPLNNFLAISFLIFNNVPSIKYIKNKSLTKYLNIFYKHLNNKKIREKHHKKITIQLFIGKRLHFIKKSFFSSQHRKWIFNRLRDRKWQNQKLIQLGLKK